MCSVLGGNTWDKDLGAMLVVALLLRPVVVLAVDLKLILMWLRAPVLVVVLFVLLALQRVVELIV